MRILTTLATLAAAALVLGACERPEREPVKGFDPATDQVATAPDEGAVAMPDDAPPQEETVDEVAVGEAGSCLSEVGAAASARLVQRCIAVSPATRPPCNAANPCEMIQGEIDRSCAQYRAGEEKPAECGA